jgi:hypothetical protein
MTAETVSIKEWIKEDAQTKAIIGWRMSPIVQNMLSEKLTAHQQWEVLQKHFVHLDVTLQYELRSQLFLEKLKDADDAARYLGVFENAWWGFAEMTVTFTDEESIFMLLNGLPDTPQWVVFRSLTMNTYKIAPSSSSTLTASPKLEEVATSFTEEANCQSGKLKLQVRPGSKYANAAANFSHQPADQRTVNPATGVWIHKHNPKGVPYENPVCNGLPRSLTHNWDHCLQSGGRMEGKLHGISAMNKVEVKRRT